MSIEIRFSARRAVVQPGVEIDNPLVRVHNGVVVEVSKSRSPSSVAHDLGAVTLVPGLVNAHTHLEFSDIEQPLGNAGMEFVEWLKLVIQRRGQTTDSVKSKRDAIRRGLDECIAAGVVAIGEIASAPIDVCDYTECDLHAMVFFERLTRNHQLLDSIAAACDDWLEHHDAGDHTMNAVSPHAPYSVHPELLAMLIDQAIKHNRPVAMHLAETRDELELLNNRSGPFVEFLESVSAWFADTYQPGSRIFDYLKALSAAPRSLVVHGNYLDDQEISFIAAQENMCVVFCPRTHAYFGHDEYPLEQYLAAGIKMAIGTDSRASNPDLDLFSELKLIRAKWPKLSNEQIMALATDASVLGFDAELGHIKPGNALTFNVLVGDGENLFAAENSCVPIRKFLPASDGLFNHHR